MKVSKWIGSLVLLFPLLAMPAPAFANGASQVGVAVSIRVGPPVLPVYTQPLCPGAGYIWEPGYWAYGVDGYYWVPGVWVLPPEPGLLWTPGYWGFVNGLYSWNVGYWGPVVGFYGGINYGFGYPGVGFYGGYWRGGQYFYNTNVTNVNTTIIHNVYNRTVVNQGGSVNRVTFNGPGGVNARPTAAEQAARERRLPMTAAQMEHQRAASTNRTMLASVNHGRPDVAATARPEALNNRSPEPRNSPANTEHPRAHAPAARPEPAPKAEPARPEPKAAPRTEKPAAHESAPKPAHTEKPAVHESAPKATHTEKPATHESAPKAAHTEKPAKHESAPKPAHTEKPATHESAPKPAHTQKPIAHESAPKPASHASAPHESQPHASESHPADNKKP